jgi:hypothetical protein
MNTKILPLIGLTLSGTAMAGPEVGAIIGYNSVTMSAAGETSDAEGGLMFGLRGGMRTDSGFAIDGQFIHQSASASQDGLDLSISQMRIGVGTRYYIGDGGVTPFVAAHLNYHLGASVSASANGSSASADLPGTSGLGADVGGGAQFGIGDSLYAEVLAFYSLQLSGDTKFNALGFGAGFGAKF